MDIKRPGLENDTDCPHRLQCSIKRSASFINHCLQRSMSARVAELLRNGHMVQSGVALAVEYDAEMREEARK